MSFSTTQWDWHLSSCFSSQTSSRYRDPCILNPAAGHSKHSALSTAYKASEPPRNMSGFFSSEAERALAGEEEEAPRLLYSDPLNLPPPPGHSVRQGQHNVPVVPSQRWPQSYSPGPSHPGPSPYMTGRYSTSPWSSLHLDDIDDTSSQFSRASSPGNPSNLQSFGYPLSDGTSWRCAYPGCSSQAIFTRGCDLRKHFRRHSKSLFCRQEGCPAATKGGFSSRKDRDRHEAKHRPDIPCEWQDCDRVFSRVDNMKDHVKRIHQKGPYRRGHAT